MVKTTEVSFDNNLNDLGEVKITKGVLESIAAQAASEVAGVVKKSAGFQRQVGSFLGMDRDILAAKITIMDDALIIDMDVQIIYGYSVPEVALNIQDKVKEQILFMTDLTVDEVNVHVLSIQTENDFDNDSQISGLEE